MSPHADPKGSRIHLWIFFVHLHPLDQKIMKFEDLVGFERSQVHRVTSQVLLEVTESYFEKEQRFT